MTKYIQLILAILFISSCTSKTEKLLGLDPAAPNEKLVETNNPLEMPPHFSFEEVSRK
ncbi:MAG: hypothetical protein SFT91_01790 [Rickettsiaceae bacterium]|nr:hypothetical protein [Rickettsiaceae bacterium]